jgi:hypothetical protein
MGWETRARGGRYYTRSRREGGRVVREYVGTGPAAELARRRDAQERARRREQAALLRAERDRLDAVDQAVAELCDLSDALARGALTLAGYHRHDRGEWRKRRA